MSQNPMCPKCRRGYLVKNGLIETKNGLVQRYVCVSCGGYHTEPALPSLNPRKSMLWAESKFPNEEKVVCPKCGSLRVWKNGLYYPFLEDAVQRYLCRDCFYRFIIRPLSHQ